MADIEIVASAVGFDQVNKALDNTTKGLDETAKASKKAGDALNTSLKPGVNQANQSLINLNRVVQDAPYGFIGIANNINPLVESFGRLRQETGSTGGALKALVSGLSGAGGLGLAVAGITTAITFLQTGFDMWFRKTKEAKQAQDDFKKSIDGATQSATANGLMLQSYINVAKDNTLSIEQRNEALKQANKIFGEHGDVLTLTNISTQKVTDSVKKYTEATIAQAVAQKYTDQIANLSIKSTDLLAQKQEKQAKVLKLLAEVNRLSAAGDYKSQKLARIAANGLIKEREDLSTQINDNQKQIEKLTASLNESIATATQSFGDLGYKEKDKKKAVKTIQSLDEYLAAFRESLKDEINIGIAFGDPRFVERLKLFQTTIEGVIAKFNQSPNSKYVIDLQTEMARLELEKFAAEAPSIVQSKVDKTKPIDLSKLLTISTPSILKSIPPLKLDTWFTKTKDDFNKAFAEFKATAITDAIIGLSESIAKVITGELSFNDAFKAVFASLGDNVKQLGQQIIKIAILKEIAEKTLFTNTGAAIAAGIGLIIAGTVLKSLLSKRSAFATGTTFAPGGMALVGERGPELVNIPRGAQVIPAAQTASMIGGRNSVEVFGVLRGQDIYFSNKKYGQTYNRQA